MTWKIIKRFEMYEEQIETVPDGEGLYLANDMSIHTSREFPGTYTIWGAGAEDQVNILNEGVPMIDHSTTVRGRGEFYIKPGPNSQVASILGFYHGVRDPLEKVIAREKEASMHFLDHPHSALERMK